LTCIGYDRFEVGPLHRQASLEGVVGSWNSATKTLGLLDESGFQLFELGSFNRDLRSGKRIRLTGQHRYAGEVPKVLKPEVIVLGSLPAVPETGSNGLLMEATISWPEPPRKP